MGMQNPNCQFCLYCSSQAIQQQQLWEDQIPQNQNQKSPLDPLLEVRGQTLIHQPRPKTPKKQHLRITIKQQPHHHQLLI